MSFSGGFEGSTEGAVACAIPFGPDAGVLMVFLPGTSIGAIEVDVDAITEGQTGTFPAAVRLRLDDEREWVTPDEACSVSVAEHAFESEDEFSKGYQMVGDGSCSEQAIPMEGSGDVAVTVSPFAFRFPAQW